MELTDDEVKRITSAVFAGEKILAIKIYRQSTKASLADAKKFVEALQERLWQESPERFRVPPDKAGCFKAAVVLLISVFAIVNWYVS